MLVRALVVSAGLLAASGCGKSGPVLVPVAGTVRVNGRPAERVAVAFHHADPAVKGNAAHPCAVTDEFGNFKLSTDTTGDGAVAGDYLVTFTWWSDPDPDRAKDLLGGAYGDPKKSTTRVTVPTAGVCLPPFELTTDANQAKTFVK